MDWTEGRLNSFITSTLRSGMRRWPPKWEALKESYVGKQLGKTSGRTAAHYRCAACAGAFPSAQVQVDHIHPVVDPVEGFTTWDNYISRLFCKVENLQVLCKPCHLVKTKEEKKCRTKTTKTSAPTKKRVTRTKEKRRSTTSATNLTTTSKAVSGGRLSGKSVTKKRKPSSKTS